MSMRTEAESLELTDLQETWRLLTPEERFEAFNQLDRHEAEDFFLELPARDQHELMMLMPASQRRSWMRLLPPDDAADLVQEANEEEREVMSSDVVTASEQMDQEELARLFAQTNLQAIPVVDASGRMKGIVTVDDIVDVIQEEATEDIQKIGGTQALEAPYLKVGLVEMVRKRVGWLAVLFVSEMLTTAAMSRFEAEIARAVVLAVFIPLIISSGGNSGSQASTLVIRAMALGEVKMGDWWRVVHRELRSGLAMGLVLGVIGLTRVELWQLLFHTYGSHHLLVGLTIAISVLGVVTWGTLSGSMLPFLLKRFRLDPASASAPFVATLVDVTGIVIYFTAASVILRGALL